MKKSIAKRANKLWVKSYVSSMEKGYGHDESVNRANRAVTVFLERAQVTINYLETNKGNQ